MKRCSHGLMIVVAMLASVLTAQAQTVLFDFETGDQGWGSFGTITTDSGLTIGSSGQGRYHVGDFSLDDLDPGNPLLWGIVDVSPLGVDLSPYSGFSVDVQFTSVPGFPEYTGDKILDIGIEIAGVEFFDTSVTMTDLYQTFTVNFADFVPAGEDLSSSRIKLLVLSSHGMGIGKIEYDEVIGLDPLPGDFDNDGDYACADIDALVVEIVAGTNNPQFDLTGDAVVDIQDRDAWLVVAGAAELPSGNPYQLGDADLDGTVDGLDFIEWNANKFTSVAAWCAGDFTADGTVDGLDFIEWNGNKFTSADSSGTQVPEPSAGWLILIGLTGVLKCRRRQT